MSRGSRKVSVVALALGLVLLMPSIARAGVISDGSTVVELGWPGSYIFSQTEKEFVAQGCSDPSSLSTRDLDAAIIDVEPGSILWLKMKDQVGSFNMAFYDDRCRWKPGFYAGVWSRTDTEFVKNIGDKDRWEWAVITFNYGYDIPFEWKVCSGSC